MLVLWSDSYTTFHSPLQVARSQSPRLAVSTVFLFFRSHSDVIAHLQFTLSVVLPPRHPLAHFPNQSTVPAPRRAWAPQPSKAQWVVRWPGALPTGQCVPSSWHMCWPWPLTLHKPRIQAHSSFPRPSPPAHQGNKLTWGPPFPFTPHMTEHMTEHMGKSRLAILTCMWAPRSLHTLAGANSNSLNLWNHYWSKHTIKYYW